ncbi:MAG: hypothetical protein QOE34_1261 [Verrucomicrobiota bacterium]|jgi:hypothetical protein
MSGVIPSPADDEGSRSCNVCYREKSPRPLTQQGSCLAEAIDRL